MMLMCKLMLHGFAATFRAFLTAFLVFSCPIFSAQVLFAAEPPAAQGTTPEQLQHLIEGLGNADYFVRQNAEAELRKMGFDAVETLTAATDYDDMEIATRASRLLCTIRSNWAVPGDSPLVSRLLANYESQDENNREARIIQLIHLPENQGLPAVCRIIRYERSHVMAKTAALRFLEAMAGDAAKSVPAEILQKGLGTCARTPARWVLTWWQARQDPQALVGIWTQFVATEEELLFEQPRETSLAIVESLLRLQIAALRKVNRGADAAASVERLIKLRRGKPAELAELLHWLIVQKDWPATRLVERRV